MTPNVSQREPTLISSTHYCVVGDVAVDASAAIAPGVVLKASPGSRIVVEKDVCLAGGVCIQSRAGVLTILAGATLGANVLIVGSGAIGHNACVSPGSTIIDPQLDADALVPPNSIVGKSKPQPATSHQPQTFSSTFSQQNGASPTIANPAGGYSQATPLPKNEFVPPGPVKAKPIQIPSIDVNAASARYDPSRNGVQLNQPYNLNNGSAASNQSSALTTYSHDRVYGRDQVSQLISTLFPNRQSLNNNGS